MERLRRYILDTQLWHPDCLLKNKHPWDLLTDEYLRTILTADEFRAFEEEERELDMNEVTANSFKKVATWSVELRYESKEVPEEDARVFLASAESVVNWAKGTSAWH